MTKQSKTYFNLTTTGVGYLNEIKTVKSKDKSREFLAIKIAALVGDSENVQYRFISCIVTGNKNKELINRCTQAVSAQKKVLISFVIGDLESFAFGFKDNKVLTGFKGHLIGVKSIKVDGALKFKAESTKQNNAPEVVSEAEAEVIEAFDDALESMAQLDKAFEEMLPF